MKKLAFLFAMVATTAFAVTTPTAIPTNTVPSSFRSTAISKINILTTATTELQDITKKKTIAVTYQPSTQGGTAVDHDTSGTLPSGAVIIRSYGMVNAPFNGSGGTIALYCQSAGDLLSPKAFSGVASNTLFEGYAGVASGASTLTKITSDCTIKATVATASQSAGKLTMWVEYVMNDN